MEFPKKIGQIADQTVQVYGPATAYVRVTVFIPLIPLFSHTCSSMTHLDPSLSPPFVPPLNNP